MASSKKAIKQDGKGKRAESCDGRPAQAEDVGGQPKSLRKEFREGDRKPRKSGWGDSFRKFAGPGDSVLTD
jgi:hypothetical protein